LSEIAVFSGNAHRLLAAEICTHLEVPLLPSRIERYANDCLGVQLQANCRERDVFIIQPLVPPVQEHLAELLLMLDAARGRVGVAHHGRDAPLCLRALRQEGRAADLDRRPLGC
jgi:ribose-phosphate pyrophosphokinase